MTVRGGTIFDGQTSDATSSELKVQGGGDVMMVAEGGFGGGTFKLQMKNKDSGDWIDIESITASDAVLVSVPRPWGVFRGDLSGSTDPDLDVFLRPVTNDG